MPVPFLRKKEVKKVEYIAIEKIRLEDTMKPEKDFVESIKATGVKVPVFVRRNGNGLYEVIDGRRRIEAARCIGMKEVPAIVVNGDPSLLGVILNIHRSPNFAHEVKRIKELLLDGHTAEEVARLLNTKKSKIYRLLRLTRLCEEGMERLAEGKISLSVALVLSTLPREQQEELLAEHEKLTLETVRSFRKKENFDSLFEELSAMEGEAVEVSMSSLETEFETFVAKISTGKLPDEIVKAIGTIRDFLKNSKERG